MQNEIQHLQTLYREWLQLQDKLATANQDWKRSCEIMTTLKQFYFEGEYQTYYEAIAAGTDVDLRTQGEYSIMGEDTLWDAFHQHQTQAWQRLRGAIAELEPQDTPE